MVRSVDTHGLLTHRTLISVTWRLVVIRERYDGSTDSKDHRRVNLAVRVRVERSLVTSAFVKIRDMHRNHCCLLFLDIEKLYQTLL